jgi:hypothetical protein
MITSIDAAMDAFDAAEHDMQMDFGEDVEIEYKDIVLAVAWDMNDDTARELCRIKLGWVPYELREKLGDKDWLNEVSW